MIFKKTVVLSSMDNSLKKALVTLDGKSSSVRGEVKLYNFVEEPMGTLTLGLLVDGKVHKAGLTRVGYMQYQFVTFLKAIPPVCTCAVISSRGGNLEPILIGSIQNTANFENLLLENLDVLKEPSFKKVEETVNQNLGDFEDQEEIEKQIDLEMEKCSEGCNGACANCNYKKAFYEENHDNQESLEASIPEPNLEEEITKGKLRVPDKPATNFIDEIGSQLQGLFDKFPPEQVLSEIIPNSKWVKVDFNKENKYYVVGLIYQDDEVKYVCYGVPGVWAEVPPDDFNPEAKFLPLDLDDPQGAGYWLTYQDAFDGELVEVNII